MMSTLSLAAFLCCFAATLCLDLERMCRFSNGMIVNDVCFYIPRQEGSFEEAVAYCERDGGVLAYPESDEEFEIMKAVSKSSCSKCEVQTGLIHDNWCIFVSYDNKMKLHWDSPWWQNGAGLHDYSYDDCEYWNQGVISVIRTTYWEPELIAEFMDEYASGKTFICKLRKEQL